MRTKKTTRTKLMLKTRRKRKMRSTRKKKNQRRKRRRRNQTGKTSFSDWAGSNGTLIYQATYLFTGPPRDNGSNLILLVGITI